MVKIKKVVIRITQLAICPFPFVEELFRGYEGHMKQDEDETR